MDRVIKRGDIVVLKSGAGNSPEMLVSYIALPDTLFKTNIGPRLAKVLWFSNSDLLQKAEFEEDLLEKVSP